MRPHHTLARFRGLTLLELMIAVVITAVLVALAAPSMRAWMIAQRVKSTAAELLTDIRYARSEGITRNRDMAVSFRIDGSQSCYTVHTTTGQACNCLNANPCQSVPGYSPIKTTSIPISSHVVVTSNPSAAYLKNGDIFFDQGAVVVTIAGLPGQSLNINFSPITRRASICAPSGSTISGYPACT